MPIFLNEATQKFELRCVNKHGEDPTMVRAGDCALVCAKQDQPKEIFILDKAIPVQLYCCTVCSYVELYSEQKPVRVG